MPVIEHQLLDDVIVRASAARVHLAIAGHGPPPALAPDEPRTPRHDDCGACRALAELDVALLAYRNRHAR